MTVPDLKKNTITASPEMVMAIAVISAFVAIIIPIPGRMLDVLIAFSLAASIILMLTVVYISKAVHFSVFPSLLLITTAYRLALNVSSTRLILMQGPDFDVAIIKGFGSFVTGGSFIIGFIIFAIFVLAQFLIITKGATRVAEVAARFTLEGMQASLLAVDSDVAAGALTEEEARIKRSEIQQTADFYGAMDGAAKFVKGDVQLGLIITAINFLGGVVLGTTMHGMNIGEAATFFGTLTVGDGLVSQVPALLISYATGLIVTRSSTQGNLGSDLLRQITAQPDTFYIAAGFVFLMGLIPHFPTLWLFLVAAILAGAAFLIKRDHETKKEEHAKEAEEQKAAVHRRSERFGPEPLDLLELDFGYALVPLVDKEKGGDLLDRITSLRRAVAMELGIIIPPVRIRDNTQLEPDEYSIKLKGVEIASGHVRMDKMLVLIPQGEEDTIELTGEQTVDPAFGTPALWIDPDERIRAETAGLTVVDASTILATHLTEVVKGFAHELLNRQETQKLLDGIKEINPAVVEEVTKTAGLGTVQKVLQNLLKEGISVRDLTTILETIADHINEPNVDAVQLTEYVRTSLSRQISTMNQTADNEMEVITFTPDVIMQLQNSMSADPAGMYVDPALQRGILHSMKQQLSELNTDRSIVLVPSNLRVVVKSILERNFPHVVVLAYSEIIPSIKVQSIGQIQLSATVSA